MGCGPSHDFKGQTPLEKEALRRRHAAVALLAERFCPLLAASKAGDVEAMTQLLDGGAAVDQAKGDGTTSLWIACQNGRVDAARLLLDKGAEVDRAKKGGFTPLYVACLKSRVDAARLLLDKGAKVNRATRNGNTPLSIAKKNGHSSIVALLEEHQK